VKAGNGAHEKIFICVPSYLHRCGLHDLWSIALCITQCVLAENGNNGFSKRHTLLE